MKQYIEALSAAVCDFHQTLFHGEKPWAMTPVCRSFIFRELSTTACDCIDGMPDAQVRPLVPRPLTAATQAAHGCRRHAQVSLVNLPPVKLVSLVNGPTDEL